jgi:hypothetical protein
VVVVRVRRDDEREEEVVPFDLREDLGFGEGLDQGGQLAGRADVDDDRPAPAVVRPLWEDDELRVAVADVEEEVDDQ